MRFVVGIFMVLHGLVHLLYFAQSWRFFELQPGMVWPDGSWAFSRLLGEERTRLVASSSCILATIAFVVGGAGVFTGQAWWRPLVVSAAVFSIVIFIMFWDGKMQKLDMKGGIGLLINVSILVAMSLLRRRDFEF